MLVLNFFLILQFQGYFLKQLLCFIPVTTINTKLKRSRACLMLLFFPDHWLYRGQSGSAAGKIFFFLCRSGLAGEEWLWCHVRAGLSPVSTEKSQVLDRDRTHSMSVETPSRRWTTRANQTRRRRAVCWMQGWRSWCYNMWMKLEWRRRRTRRHRGGGRSLTE